VGGQAEDEIAVDRRQMGSDQRDRREMEATVGQHLEHDRVLPGDTSGRDAQVGLGSGQVKALGAVLEHGWRRLAGVQPTRVDFADVGH
jgi:hypothetical protein